MKHGHISDRKSDKLSILKTIILILDIIYLYYVMCYLSFQSLIASLLGLSLCMYV